MAGFRTVSLATIALVVVALPSALTANSCDVPPAPANGATIPASGTVGNGSSVVYGCFDGYGLSGGDSVRLCSSGVLLGTAPLCRGVICHLPREPDGVFDDIPVAGTPAIFPGSAVHYRCSSPGGSITAGSSERHCFNGVLNGTQPECAGSPISSMLCRVPQEPEHGFDDLRIPPMGTPAVFHGTAIRYGCESGYSITTGSSVRHCVNGVVNGTPPECTLNPCDVPPAPANGATIPASGTVRRDSAVSYGCFDGYTLTDGDAVRTCVGSVLRGTAPTCTPITVTTGTSSTGTTSTGTTGTTSTGTTSTGTTGTTSTGTTSTGTTGTTSTGTTGTTSTGTTSTGTTAANPPEYVVREGSRSTRYFYQSPIGVAWLKGVYVGPLPAPPGSATMVPTALYTAAVPLDDSLKGRDQTYVKTTLAPGETAATLYAVRYTADVVPGNAEILGIKFSSIRYSSLEGLRDISMKLIVDGVPVNTSEKYAVKPSVYWYTKESNFRVGGPSDLWGFAPGVLTPAVINSRVFGVAIVTKNVHATRTIDAYFNELSMTVTYRVASLEPGRLMDANEDNRAEQLDVADAAAGNGLAVTVVAVAVAAAVVAALAAVVVVARRRAALRRVLSA